ncbi:hypothetical protein CLROS_040180 [Clostridium felsineum]|uniref:Uncharacterized protein n=1 Tax=Clostridium felsineum TaxID=36839 RepID=A0A1S8M9W8_9CLOT|nr:hypothetical protein CLROS_040180 [Clostridium felsineum]URZ13666.1 hypothetical protein CROST_044320 [Clostridium felsineum]
MGDEFVKGKVYGERDCSLIAFAKARKGLEDGS